MRCFATSHSFILFSCWPACVNMEKELTSTAGTNTAGQLLHTNSNKLFPAVCHVEQAQTQSAVMYPSHGCTCAILSIACTVDCHQSHLWINANVIAPNMAPSTSPSLKTFSTQPPASAHFQPSPFSHPALATGPSLSNQKLQKALDLTDYYLTGKNRVIWLLFSMGLYTFGWGSLILTSLLSGCLLPWRISKSSQCQSESVGIRTGTASWTDREYTAHMANKNFTVWNNDWAGLRRANVFT